MNVRNALITGASSGIGRATALHLAERGYRVFAGVRKQADAEALAEAASGELTPLILDVTDGAAIEAAAARIADAGGGLAALVNNAGAAYSGPMELVPLDDFRHQLEVNLVGHVAVTQAMLPALREARGRIINITSIGGIVATPFYGPYCASKFAFEAISDCQRVELRPWGIETIVIEPGSIATGIWASGAEIAEGVQERMGPRAAELYGEAMAAMAAVSTETGARGIPPEAVAKTIHTALTAKRPRARYLVGRDAYGMATASRLLPARLYDRIAARMLKLP